MTPSLALLRSVQLDALVPVPSLVGCAVPRGSPSLALARSVRLDALVPVPSLGGCAVPRAPGVPHLGVPVPVRVLRGCAVPRAPGYSVLDALVPVRVVPGCAVPRAAGEAPVRGCWLGSARGGVEPSSPRTRGTHVRGWAGISARRLRCSSVGPLDVLPSVSDRGRRIPTGTDPKNRPGAPQRGAGNCAKPPSDGTATKCAPPDRPHKRERRRPTGLRETTGRRHRNRGTPSTGRPQKRKRRRYRWSSCRRSSSSLPPAIWRVSSSRVIPSRVWLPDIAPRFSSTNRSPTR
ncbi:hypothetical protein YW7DRAFT_04104 [Streptomyces sp. AmelKG-E11A]|nr:hypothetical protein YW7DRAFT_04104 [Streptomyces sp. AmelKG-E11A]